MLNQLITLTSCFNILHYWNNFQMSHLLIILWSSCFSELAVSLQLGTQADAVMLSHISISLVMSWLLAWLRTHLLSWVKKNKSFYILTFSSVKMRAAIGGTKDTLMTKINISNSVFCKELYICLIVIILWCSPCSWIRMISLTHFPLRKSVCQHCALFAFKCSLFFFI